MSPFHTKMTSLNFQPDFSNKIDLMADFDTPLEAIVKPKLHIRVQQRNGKKSITTVQGFETDLDVKRICKHMRKHFNCNGNVTSDPEKGEVIQLQGDQRDNVKEWILVQEIISKNEADRIVIHGF